MQLLVRKRDGKSVEPFDQQKVFTAIHAATHELQRPMLDKDIDRIADYVQGRAKAKAKDGEIGVEKIQDIVVQALMDGGYHETATCYIIYRHERSKLRAEKPIPQETIAAIKSSRALFKSDLSYFQFVNKYARFDDNLGRRETWQETNRRVSDFFRWQIDKMTAARKEAEGMFAQDLPPLFTDAEFKELEAATVAFEAFPAMRVMQMAGEPLKRCNVGSFNCAACAITSVRSFAEILYVLMQGTGCGFSVESEFIEDLPKIKRQKKHTHRHKFVIPDSTEGWCDALAHGMQAWYDGADVEFDYSLIRPAGAKLRTKGGRASGPAPLKELLDFAKSKILSRQGKRLRSIDSHDIACKIGKIVQVGGVRRAAMISVSDLDDVQMRDAKAGAFWSSDPQRTMANNSAVFAEEPDDETFLGEWYALVRSKSGERGIWNRWGMKFQIPKRRKWHVFLPNPCGEINLRPDQFCNLSIAVCRPGDTVESLKRKVRIAAIYGTLQSTLTDFKYIHPGWKKNCEEERLLGVDLIGGSDCPLLAWSSDPAKRAARNALLDELRLIVIETNQQLSARLGINPSTATTCIKPSGNSSVFLDAGNTITGRYAHRQVRRVRCNSIDPVAQFLIDSGVPHAPEYDDPNPKNPAVWVFDFPWESPNPDGITKDDMTAIEQLENWLDFKSHWTEHNPSATIYVGHTEWVEVGAWVRKHFKHIGGLSFLPRDNGIYPLAPNESLDDARFEAMRSSFPSIPWEKLPRYEDDDHTTVAQEFACSGAGCDV